MLKLKGFMKSQKVFLNDEELNIKDSLKIHNHSPTGFSWGYGGSGPAQLSLAVLLKCFNKDIAIKHYQNFKWAYISRLPQTDFEIEIDIENWMNEIIKLEDI